MLETILILGILFAAVQAIRAIRLLTAALWLAGVSALLACLLYALGAPEIAVIELSVGAGLVTVLFVFAISIAGDEILQVERVLPKPVAWGLVIIALLLLGWLILPFSSPPQQVTAVSYAAIFWEQRGLDALVQTGLIFAGVLGVLGLLAGTKTSPAGKGAQRLSVTNHPRKIVQDPVIRPTGQPTSRHTLEETPAKKVRVP